MRIYQPYGADLNHSGDVGGGTGEVAKGGSASPLRGHLHPFSDGQCDDCWYRTGLNDFLLVAENEQIK